MQRTRLHNLWLAFALVALGCSQAQDLGVGGDATGDGGFGTDGAVVPGPANGLGDSGDADREGEADGGTSSRGGGADGSTALPSDAGGSSSDGAPRDSSSGPDAGGDAADAAPSCRDVCVLTSRVCQGSAAVRTCVRGDSGCLEWSAPESCGDGRACSAGTCTRTCFDACSAGSKQCSAGGGVSTCERQPTGCLDWSAPSACAHGCHAGACLPDPCTGLVCDAPPPSGCLDNTRRVEYASVGSCRVSGSGASAVATCDYAPREIACPDGCGLGACGVPAPTPTWWNATTLGPGSVTIADMIIGPDGWLYVVGSFHGTIDLGTGPLNAEGGQDGFVARVGADFRATWVGVFGGTGMASPLKINFRYSTDLVIAGSYTGQLAWKTGDFTRDAIVTSADTTDVFIGHVQPGFSPRLSVSSARIVTGRDDYHSISGVMDCGVDVCILGTLRGTVRVGSTTFASGFKYAALLTRVNGPNLSATMMAGSDDVWASSLLRRRTTGAILVGGGYDGTMNGVSRASAGGRDGFIVEVPASGPIKLVHAFGSIGFDHVYGLAETAQLDIVATGAFQGTVDFGGARRTATAGQSGFVVKYRSDDTVAWATVLGGTRAYWPSHMRLDQAGAMYLTGFIQNNSASDRTDLFATKLGPAGTVAWDLAVPGGGDQVGTALAPTQGRVYVAGYTHGTFRLGGADVTSGTFLAMLVDSTAVR